MVRLHAADGDQCIRIRRDHVRYDLFRLAELISAHCETGVTVIALGINLDLAIESIRHSWKMFDRSRTEGQRIALEFFELHAGAHLVL